MTWFAPLQNVLRRRVARPANRRVRLQTEQLESRVVPFSWSGNAWVHPELITLSIVPDGTNVNGYASNLIANFNARFGAQTTWQNVLLKAAQVWAQQTNLNFRLVTDSGAAWGSGSNQQGEAGFGDIRIGGYNFGNSILAQAYLPPPVNNYSVAGDIAFNTAQNFHIGTTYDLFTVAAHEIGHALGLYHGSSNSVMSAIYPGTFPSLAADDINGIRSVYSGGSPRSPDSYEGMLGNNTSATATDITPTIDTATKTALVTDRDLTTTSDSDWYKFTVPADTTGTLKVTVQSTGLSLLNPKVDLYSSVLGLPPLTLQQTANAGTYGGTISVTHAGAVADQVYYVKVSSTDGIGAFRTGKYALTLNMGTGVDPVVPLPNTQTANGSPLSSGGGLAIVSDWEARANSTTTGIQAVSPYSQSSTAMDDTGDFVVAWSSFGQDASETWGVYAQRYDASGAAQGGEFRVNSTADGDQMYPTVAMRPNGAFVIAWSSFGQDTAGSWGVYAQRYDASGAAQGGEFRVNSTTADDQEFPAVAVDNSGNFVISWSSKDQDKSDSWGVYARRYNAYGSAQGGEFRVNTTVTGDQIHSSVDANEKGNFAITWSSFGQDAAGSWGVYARRYNAYGSAQGGEFRVNTTTAGDQKSSRVAVDGDGNLVVVWTSDGRDGSGQGIYVQRYNSSGAPRGTEIRVNTTTLGDQTSPAVAIDSRGNFAVTWASYGQDSSDSWGVYAQQFSATGIAIASEFLVNSTTAGDQQYPSVAMDGDRTLTISWGGAGTGDADGVFFQRYDINTVSQDPTARGNYPEADGSVVEGSIPTGEFFTDEYSDVPFAECFYPAEPSHPLTQHGSPEAATRTQSRFSAAALAAFSVQKADYDLLAASLVAATPRRKARRP